ncbi:MAG: DUF6893 family small protein [Jatrophihabitans sp.]
MAVLGKLTSLVLLAAVAGGVLVGIRSVPDIQRYLRMRNM